MSNQQHQNEDTELCEQCREQNIPGSLREDNTSVSPLYWYIEGWPGVGPRLSSICSFCRLLAKVVALHEPLRREKIGTQWRVKVSQYGFLGLQSISQHKIRIERLQASLEFRRPDENYWVVERESQHGLQLAFDGFNQDIFGRLGHNRPVPSQCDFSLFRDWIELCGNHHHDACRPVRYDLDFPLRLIDVKRHCVVMAASNSRYVALSYVWGIKRQLTLGRGTLQAFGTDGSLYENHQLPKTIKDAMTATRNLGERFLWVDALTIVQDDKQDNRESNQSVD
ncbi:HET-domain-containing protein [Acephala macrosclerotiorum]|nr:HET-domain-containing protein [Acephala macrosclerotiorum]